MKKSKILFGARVEKAMTARVTQVSVYYLWRIPISIQRSNLQILFSFTLHTIQFIFFFEPVIDTSTTFIPSASH